MQLKVGDRQFRVEVVEDEQFESKHTGRVLERLTVEFSAPHAAHDEVESILRQAKKEGLISIADTEPDRSWQLENHSYSYSDASPLRNYSWELEEHEEVRAEMLILDALELEPYAYKEIWGKGDALVIIARFRLSPSQQEAFHALQRGDQYFRVVRRGISDEPRTMRFGQTLWSRDDGVIKQQVVLVDQSYDDVDDLEPNFLQLIEPGMSRVQDMLAEKAEAFDELVRILVAKGVLTEADRQRIDEVSEDPWQRHHEFDRLTDLDSWPF